MSIQHLAFDVLRHGCCRCWRGLCQPQIVRHMGIRIEVGPHVSPEVRNALYRGAYERIELRGIRRHLAPDDIVLEIGTGLGFVAMYIARRIGAERVFTFEANPALEAPIRRNFTHNHLFPTLEIGMLSATAGVGSLKVGPDFWTASSVHVAGDHQVVPVPQRPLNETIRRIDPTFLVVDIEGAEYQLSEEIEYHHITKISMELHPAVIGADGAAAVRQRIRAAGFREAWSCADGRYVLFRRPGARGR